MVTFYQPVDERAFFLPDAGRSMGVHVMAGKGSGKSRLLGRILGWQDFVNERPLVIFDPQGGTIDNFLDKLVQLDESAQRELASRILYVDMRADGEYVVPFPLYYRNGDDDLFDVAQRYLLAVAKLDPDLKRNPRLGLNALLTIGRYVGIVLAALGCQITEAEDLLNRPQQWLPRLEQLGAEQPATQEAVSYFRDTYVELAKRPNDKAFLIDSFVTKIIPFRLDQSNRAMFGATLPGIDWQDVVDRKLAVLLDFRGEHSDHERIRFKTLWSFTSLVTFLKSRGMAGRDQPVSVIVDELTYLLSLDPRHTQLLAADFDELINRVARNYGVWLTLAHQELYQVPEDIQKHLMTMGTQVFGKTTEQETALLLAERFFPFDPWWTKKRDPIYMSDMGRERIIDYRDVEFTIQEQHQVRSRQFLNLPPLRFLVSAAEREGMVGTRLQRVSIEPFDRGIYPDESIVSQARTILMERTGRPVSEVLAEIDARAASVLSVQPIVDTIKHSPASSDQDDHADDLLTEKRPRAAKKTTSPPAPSSRGRPPTVPPHRKRPGDP